MTGPSIERINFLYSGTDGYRIKVNPPITKTQSIWMADCPGIEPMTYSLPKWERVDPVQEYPPLKYHKIVILKMISIRLGIEPESKDQKRNHLIDLPDSFKSWSSQSSLRHNIGYGTAGSTNMPLKYFPADLVQLSTQSQEQGRWVRICSLAEHMRQIKLSTLEWLPFYVKGILRYVSPRCLQNCWLLELYRSWSRDDHHGFLWVRAPKCDRFRPFRFSQIFGITSNDAPEQLCPDGQVATILVTYEELLEGFLDQITHQEIYQLNKEYLRNALAQPTEAEEKEDLEVIEVKAKGGFKGMEKGKGKEKGTERQGQIQR